MCRTLHLRNRATALDLRGLTLIEVLCVLIIAIILLIVVMPRYGHGNARLTATVTQIAVFKTQLSVFRDDNGFYPVGTNGLQDLVRQPAATTNWHGPYAQDIPKDPWGRDYVYEIPGKHTSSGYPYDLFSLGPTPGTNVIANWAFPSLKP
jgi:general secretion pathway protein G